MTLYVILGEGEMPPKEIKHQLDDLWKQCEEADTDFWFAMDGKQEPTETDKAIVSYFNKNGIHFGLFRESDQYEGVSEYFDGLGMTPKAVVELMVSRRAESEDAVLLALFTNDDEKDGPLIDIISDVLLSGFKVYGLNDAMEPVELLTEEVKPMPEDTIEPRPALTIAAPEGDEDNEPEPLNRQYLESLTANEVKEIAKGMGLTPGVKAETIKAILVSAGVEEGEVPPVVVSAPAPEVADTPVTPPEPSQHGNTNTSSTMLSDETVLVVIHTKTGMMTSWTTTDKVRGLL